MEQFLDLAGKPSKTGIRAFANEHGWLGVWIPVRPVDGGPLGWAEPYQSWVTELEAFTEIYQTRERLLVSESQLAVRRPVAMEDYESLAKRFVQGPAGIEFRYGSLITHLDRLPLQSDRELMAAVRHGIAGAINDHLHHRVDLKILPQGRQHYRHQIDSNLAAIYFEFASLFTGSPPRSRECDQCGTFFIRSRRDQKFCSDRCRALYSYHYRKEGVRDGS
jgi:hypothetical protein